MTAENIFTGIGTIALVFVIAIFVLGFIAISGWELYAFVTGTRSASDDPPWYYYVVGPILTVVILGSLCAFANWLGAWVGSISK